MWFSVQFCKMTDEFTFYLLWTVTIKGHSEMFNHTTQGVTFHPDCTKHTCWLIMLLHQHLDTSHLSGRWIISVKRSSVTRILTRAENLNETASQNVGRNKISCVFFPVVSVLLTNRLYRYALCFKMSSLTSLCDDSILKQENKSSSILNSSCSSSSNLLFIVI